MERTSEPASIPEERSAQPLDVDRDARRRQRDAWGAGDYAVIGTRLVITSELLCEAADLRAGARVLDVACGHGNTALAAARRGAITTGVDLVPALLERARERAAAERLDVEWLEADAERLPFEDAEFDAVLSTFGVMFAADQRRAARELLRVCRPGGRIGLACWTPDAFAGEMFRILVRHAPPPPGAARPMDWGTPERLWELLGDGVAEIDVERRQFVHRYLSPEHWLEVFRTWFGPLRKAFESLDVERQAELSGELVEALRRHDRSGGESLVAPMDYLEIVATRR